MTKKDVSELTRRFKKEECTFTRMCGCYVDAQKNIVLHMNETFLNLTDEECFKYLEIAKKTLSGTVGNNLLDLTFTPEEDDSSKQQFLLGLKASKLKNEDLLLRLYELIIASYEYVGNYLILVFHDAYDVITKTKDNNKLDESEEVYEYLLCAICPVELSKSGLGYHKEDNKIAPRIRDWVVSPPETGFLFPAFSDRSSDVNSIIYYTKNPKMPHPQLMEAGLGCKPRRTTVEEKSTFQSILQNVLGDDDDDANDKIMEIQQTLSNLVDEHNTIYEEPVFLDESTIHSVILESGFSEEVAAKIQQSCKEEFGDAPPAAKNLVDLKALAVNAKKIKEQELQKQVHILTQQLEETTAPSDGNYNIVLKVNPQKVSQIKSQIVDGVKCILIPIDENEQATINGLDTEM